jgi:hypothetical protein
MATRRRAPLSYWSAKFRSSCQVRDQLRYTIAAIDAVVAIDGSNQMSTVNGMRVRKLMLMASQVGARESSAWQLTKGVAVPYPPDHVGSHPASR